MTKIAVIGDIHSNLEALEAVLKDIKSRRVTKIYCVGDIVGYGANPNECINLIRKAKIKCVAGNHDFYVLEANDISWFTPAGQTALLWTHIQMTKTNMAFLEKLPSSISEEGIFFAHGSPRDPLHEYVFPDLAEWHAKVFFRLAENNKIIALGHTHVPFEKMFKSKKCIFNPGSVGQPRDGNPKASYCIFDTKKKKVEFHRVKYNIKKAAEKIMKAGLPKSLADRLFRGK